MDSRRFLALHPPGRLHRVLSARMFKPKEPSPPLTPEREAARQRLNENERKMVEAMERELGRPLTEEEEHLVLEPGALIEQPHPHDPHCDQPGAF